MSNSRKRLENNESFNFCSGHHWRHEAVKRTNLILCPRKALRPTTLRRCLLAWFHCAAVRYVSDNRYSSTRSAQRQSQPQAMLTLFTPNPVTPLKNYTTLRRQEHV